MPFERGKSGNPAGRPRGAKDKRTKYREMLEPHAPKLMKKAVELAMKGDAACLRLTLERLLPALKSEGAPVALPALAEAATLSDQGRAVLAAVAEGSLSPDRAGTLLQAIAAQAKAVEVDELVRRVEALEARGRP